jgi:hypothetical protein
MAATIAAGQVPVTSGAPVRIVAANSGRAALVLNVMGGGIAFGPDNTVTYDTGLIWRAADGPLVDNLPATGDWWAISAPRKAGRVTFCEWSS